jgi:hypothetical protein
VDGAPEEASQGDAELTTGKMPNADASAVRFAAMDPTWIKWVSS